MVEFSEEELKKLKKCFEDLGVKPKIDSPEDLLEWMGNTQLKGKR